MTEREIFMNCAPNFKRLSAFGFRRKDGDYVYKTLIADKQLQLTVTVSDKGDVSAKVYDAAADGEYVLHRNDSAVGAFVTAVRTDFERVLVSIVQSCFTRSAFCEPQSHEIIKYVREKYGDELEFLWKNSPKSAVFRRKDSEKWYAVMLAVSRKKLGQDSDSTAEILDLRAKPEFIEKKVDGRRLLPGWHMSKKHWFTVCLDGSVPTADICRMIDESYSLAVK